MTNADLSRQSFLGAHSDDELRITRVAIVGLGGGGSHIAQQLAHLGVGHFTLIDPDVIEASNLNRLVGGTQADVDNRTPKVDILARMIRSIRPDAIVVTSQHRWQEADALLKDSHVLFGCIDGYQQRDFLETAARRFLLPYIDIGMDVTAVGEGHYAIAGQVILSRPGHPCMRCIGFLTPERLAREEIDYGDAGINPQVVWTNGMLASLAVGEFVRLRAPWLPVHSPFVWHELDGNSQTVAPSRQPEYRMVPANCPHHGGADGLGDAFFKLSKLA
ncbi:HesA/MoeB/ThiF family protein [Sphingopyxis terrae]|uniref:HesA/MoeB/ThiF family protein n=1 Tax=Sphingopyxis terrae TaxID=33052 RepID=UPI001C2C2A7D|nr:ThiF family adenylyltransferase [Sphingopyxis terrae]QXF11105.1 ThiF family adenylyltransferase [Sphingopyxis terrae subsp. terrae]